MSFHHLLSLNHLSIILLILCQLSIYSPALGRGEGDFLRGGTGSVINNSLADVNNSFADVIEDFNDDVDFPLTTAVPLFLWTSGDLGLFNKIDINR